MEKEEEQVELGNAGPGSNLFYKDDDAQAQIANSRKSMFSE